MTLKTGSQSTI